MHKNEEQQALMSASGIIQKQKAGCIGRLACVCLENEAECFPGVNLSVCFLPSGCPPGWFGADCVQRCNCSNGGVCDSASGNCTCGLGWTGTHCDKGDTAHTLQPNLHLHLLLLITTYVMRCSTVWIYVHVLLFLTVSSCRMSCGEIWCQLPADMCLS